jgi:hypothetical protein
MVLIGQSCNQKKPVKPVQGKENLHPEALGDSLIIIRTPPMNDSLRNKLLDSAIMQGNKDAYSRVANSQDFLGPNLLFQALIMANKYNDSRACFDVYFMLCEEGYDSLSINLGTIDKRTKAIGLYYLLKSYELGFSDAKGLIEEKYIDKHLPVPKTSDYLIFK